MITTSGVEAMETKRKFHNAAAIEKWVKLIRQAEVDEDDKQVGSLINSAAIPHTTSKLKNVRAA